MLHGHRAALSGTERDVLAQALRLLHREPRLLAQLADVDLQFEEEALVICGRLPSFYLKQLVQTALKALDGVERIENRVEVCAVPLASHQRARAARRA